MITKSDYPALRMKVERGHLVPAGPFDAERLASYRNGAIVMCRFTEERDRVLLKKWFAIIGLVLKQCDTPWKNKDEAHEAIKLALGIVNLSKTVGGDFMQYPKSLSELDDPEMTEALQNMTELLSRMTGVDVETLRKETAHIVEHETTESGSSPHPEPDADEATPPASSAGVTESLSSVTLPLADAPVSEARPDDAEAEAADATAPNASAASNNENEVLIRFAADLLPKAANSEISTGTLKAIEKRWIEVAIAGLSDDGKDTARLICATMRNIANGKVKLKDEAVELAEVLGCPPSDIGG